MVLEGLPLPPRLLFPVSFPACSLPFVLSASFSFSPAGRFPFPSSLLAFPALGDRAAGFSSSRFLSSFAGPSPGGRLWALPSPALLRLFGLGESGRGLPSLWFLSSFASPSPGGRLRALPSPVLLRLFGLGESGRGLPLLAVPLLCGFALPPRALLRRKTKGASPSPALPGPFGLGRPGLRVALLSAPIL